MRQMSICDICCWAYGLPTIPFSLPSIPEAPGPITVTFRRWEWGGVEWGGLIPTSVFEMASSFWSGSNLVLLPETVA